MKKNLFLLLSSLFLPIALLTALAFTALFIAVYCFVLPLLILGGTIKYGGALVNKLEQLIFPERTHQRPLADDHYKRITVHLLLALVILPQTAVPVAITAVLLIPVLILVTFCTTTVYIATKLAGKLMKNPFDEKNSPDIDSSDRQMSRLKPSSKPGGLSKWQNLKDFPHTKLFSKGEVKPSTELNEDLTGSVEFKPS